MLDLVFRLVNQVCPESSARGEKSSTAVYWNTADREASVKSKLSRPADAVGQTAAISPKYRSCQEAGCYRKPLAENFPYPPRTVAGSAFDTMQAEAHTVGNKTFMAEFVESLATGYQINSWSKMDHVVQHYTFL